MVLEEAQQFLLVAEISSQMKPNTLRIAMFQTIIEPLVVTEVETLALQFPLQVPVSFGDEAEVRMRALNRGDHLTPVVGQRRLPHTSAPRAFEDLVQQKHGHVATDSIAQGRNAGERFNHCLSKSRLKRIQLQHIWPCREVRVPSAGKEAPWYFNVGCRVVSGVLGVRAKEVVNVLVDPRVIRGHMVRHEIQNSFVPRFASSRLAMARPSGPPRCVSTT